MTAPGPVTDPPRSLGVFAVLLTVVVAFVASQVVTGIAIALTVAALAITGRIPGASLTRGEFMQGLVRHPLMLSLAAVATGATIAVTGLIALRIIRAPFWASTTATNRARPLHAALGVLLVLACAPFADLAASAFQRAFPRLTFGVLDTLEQAARAPGWSAAIFFLSISLIPGFAEELFFRGVVQRSLVARIGAPAGIALASLIFGAFHLEPAQAIGAAMLGAPLGFLAWRTRSLLPSMIAHAANNALALATLRADIADSEAAPPDALLLAGAGTVLLLTGYALVRTTARPSAA